MSKTIQLKIDVNTKSLRNINKIEPIKIRKILLAKEYEQLTLIGVPIEECLLGVKLY